MKHFEMSEFECPCCNQIFMHGDFLISLDDARELADVLLKLPLAIDVANIRKL